MQQVNFLPTCVHEINRSVSGAQPRTLDVFDAAAQDPAVEDKVLFYRSVFDFQDLLERMENTKAVAIIGGGFLGSELACALARKGKKDFKVNQIFRESGNMGKILPEYLSFWTTNKVKGEGVNVRMRGCSGGAEIEVALAGGG